MISKLLMFVFMVELIWIGKQIGMGTGFFFVAGMQALLAILAIFEGGEDNE